MKSVVRYCYKDVERVDVERCWLGVMSKFGVK